MGTKRHELSEQQVANATLRRNGESRFIVIDYSSKLGPFWDKPYRVTIYKGDLKAPVNPRGMPQNSMFMQTEAEARDTFGQYVDQFKAEGFQSRETVSTGF